MTPETELHLAYEVLNAPLRTFPFPHLYVQGVFPADFYAELQRNMPDPASMLRFEEVRRVKGYEERFALDISGPMESLAPDRRQFWGDMSRGLLNGALRGHLLTKFDSFVRPRFESGPVRLYDETYLVQDTTRYALGPHTDAPWKVITVVFYLPPDTSQAHLGTSIYVPKERAFRCPGGPHYKAELFDRVTTMPFMPNSMFAFAKNDQSFHGVEQVLDPDVRRWLLLYDIRVRREA